MNVEHAEQFISLLRETAWNEGTYIVKTDHGFHLTEYKDQKNLTTHDIVKISEEIFEKFHGSEEDAGLGAAILDYTCRLYSKNIAAKILTKLPFQLQPILNLFFSIMALKDPLLKRINKLVDPRDIAYDEKPEEIHAILNSFHHKILNSQTERIFLDGMRAGVSLIEVMEDLLLFKAQLSENEHEKIDLLLEDLKFSLSISNRIHNLLKRRNISKEDHEKMAASLTHEVISHIENISEKRSCLISSVSKGHGIMIEIEKRSDEYSLSIIDPDDLKKIYTGLKITDLSKDLISYVITPHSDTPSHIFDQEIEILLCHKNSSNLRQEQSYKRQKQSLCGYKRLTPILRSRLKEHYLKYKVFITEREIEKLQTVHFVPRLLIHRANPEISKEIVEQMLNEGDAVLSKRSTKTFKAQSEL